MNLFSSPWDIFSPLLVWGLGLPVARWVGSQYGQTQKRSFLLYVWHTLWCIAYLIFTFTSGGDALMYYAQGLQELPDFELGTQFVIYFTYFLASPLFLSYLSCFLVYNIIGFVGFIGLDAILQQLTYAQSNLLKRLAALIIFLPSLSFWSSAIGKDGFAFSAAVLALWACLDLSRRIPVIFLAVLVMLLVRPHVAAFMVLALIVDSIFNRQVSPLRRIGLALILLVAANWLFPLVSEYVGIGGIENFNDASAYVESKQSYNQYGGGSIDISSMPLLIQLPTYILRPALFDVNSFFSFAAAIDNSILLSILVFGLSGFLRGRRLPVRSSSIFMYVYIAISWLVFATTTANLGISIRQKWMFLPMMLYISFALACRAPKSTKYLNNGSDKAATQSS